MNRFNHCPLGPKPEDREKITRDLERCQYKHMLKTKTKQERLAWLNSLSERDRKHWLEIAKEVNRGKG